MSVSVFRAFNSLSRDHISSESLSVSVAVTFNSLSRDHIEFVELVTFAHLITFQLPLSGSPSPIPGFSGSPRLSAAAPFRTNDF